MSRGILYPGVEHSTISSKEDWTSNFFTVPYDYYKDSVFMNNINSANEVTPPSYEIGYDDPNAKWNDGNIVTADSIVKKMNKALNIDLDGNPMTSFRKQTLLYNRFKVPSINDTFQKGFPHVFFVRPNLNLLEDSGKKLRPQIQANSNFLYAWNNSPDLIYQLVGDAPNMDHDWMFYLSNKAESFSLSDEYIETGTYGKTWTGWQVTYGKHNIASKTSGDFSIKYTDDRNLHIYHLHKLWVEYIANCYRGTFTPRKEDIFNKIRDYATAVYYIVTAEDGETIIFWSKYYGVFPTTIPSTHLSWTSGQVIQKQEFDIKYNFSFKEDFNPLALIEFNTNTRMQKIVPYIATYDPNLGHVGNSWVGAPFIELVDNHKDDQYGDNPYTFKLRYKTPNSMGEKPESNILNISSTEASKGTVGVKPQDAPKITTPTPKRSIKWVDTNF